jgi:hypothetical protein
MEFKLKEAIEILERTPNILEALLLGISDGWLTCNEGEGTWNAIEVLGHLIEGEKNNWIPRLEFMLQEGTNKPFPPFDRFSHLNSKSITSLEEKFLEFKKLRIENIQKLKELIFSESQIELIGKHPQFGDVKVRELISTWAVHDFTHITQIVRVMSERYREDVGPWIEFLGVLHNRSS